MLCGAPDDDATRALLARGARQLAAQPRRPVVPPGTALPPIHPAAGKGQIDGRATAYICRGHDCSLPLTNEAELIATSERRWDERK